MDLRHKTRIRILVLATATALAGAAFYFSGGLYPQWWLMWVAPCPLLMLAPRLSWREASMTVLGARILGGLSMWSYYHAFLHLPFGMVIELLLLPAIPFMLAPRLTRLSRRCWPACRYAMTRPFI